MQEINKELIELIRKMRILNYPPKDEEEIMVYHDILSKFQFDIIKEVVEEILLTEEDHPKPAKIVNKYYQKIQNEKMLRCPVCNIYHKSNHKHYAVTDFYKEVKNYYPPKDRIIKTMKILLKDEDLLSFADLFYKLFQERGYNDIIEELNLEELIQKNNDVKNANN